MSATPHSSSQRLHLTSVSQVTPPAADSGLADRIFAGDSAAETEIASRYREKVFVVAVSRTRDPEAAADISQETLLAVLIALREGRLRNPENLSSFIYGTARNLINNHIRRGAQRGEEPLPDDLNSVQPGSEPEQGERRRLVAQALQSLGPADRQILAMTLVENLKPGEIAARVNLGTDVVRARKSRALKRIRKLVREMVTKHCAQPPLNGGAQ